MLILGLSGCMAFGATACEDLLKPWRPASESEKTSSSTGERVEYNVIFTLATVPPVLAALESIENGNETYAIIERGKTYSGIKSIEDFYNAGFDVGSNRSGGFTTQEFNDMVAKVAELDEEVDGKAFFRFYVQDGTALYAAGIAANAGISADRFHAYMIEDGTGAYIALTNTYIKNKTAEQSWTVYENAVESVRQQFDTVMSKTDNKKADAVFNYNIGKAYALAALDNFTYLIQDKAWVERILYDDGEGSAKLQTAFGVEGYNEEVSLSLNLDYGKLADKVDALTEEQRTAYLTLMYGEYYEDTYATLTRVKRGDKAAPKQKLVFIGSRINGYPQFASNASYGIGGLSAGATIPATYAELDAKYKTPLLFATEEDYTSFLAVLNDEANYTSAATEEIKNLSKISCFNYYIDYMYTLKFTYALYGEEYDLIMKGHPREVIGASEEWTNGYEVTASDGTTKYKYRKLMDEALLNFHASDSVGKYIGMVPYGTAAENLAYLGADISICGLPSSTYNGYDTDVDVLFVLAATNEDIVGTGVESPASQVKERYEAGNLTFADSTGVELPTVFFNTGNVYKGTAEIYERLGMTEVAESYLARFSAWLASVHGGAVDIDAQGFGIKEVN